MLPEETSRTRFIQVLLYVQVFFRLMVYSAYIIGLLIFPILLFIKVYFFILLCNMYYVLICTKLQEYICLTWRGIWIVLKATM